MHLLMEAACKALGALHIALQSRNTRPHMKTYKSCKPEATVGCAHLPPRSPLRGWDTEFLGSITRARKGPRLYTHGRSALGAVDAVAVRTGLPLAPTSDLRATVGLASGLDEGGGASSGFLGT